jgi:glycine/serine hydroxymethyltransferase
MREPEMAVIAGLIHRVLSKIGDADEERAVLDEVHALCSKFSPYPA